MKRTEMKSNIVVQPRCRPEGRLFPRRKVAVKSHLLNGVGDFDMELSLAIQESLRYAQQHQKEEDSTQDSREIGSSGDSKVNESGEISTNSGQERTRASDSNNKAEEGKTPMASTSCCWASEEVGRLKELILTQAELLQCQQEEINEKNREIQALRSSNDALQCRLERMERRMSILKQKEDGHDVKHVDQDNGLSKFPASVSHSASVRGKVDSTRPELKRKRKRSMFFSHKKRHRYQKSLTSSEGWKDEDQDDSDDDESDDVTSGNEDNQNRTDDEDKSGDDKDNEEVEDSFEDLVITYPMMETESLYHLYYPKHVFSCLETRVAPPERNSQSEVETPSWRLKPLTNLYQLEGTENITDEAYLKRHQKFELEEKRRKRWDMQRLRELRIFEKQQKQKEDEMRASQDEADVETFLPSIHDLTHIEVTGAIPVMAFGQPVPFVSPSEFEIPWDISSSAQSTSSSTRHKNGTTNRRH